MAKEIESIILVSPSYFHRGGLDVLFVVKKNKSEGAIMPELTDKDTIKLAFDYYTGLGFSIADSYQLIDLLFRAKVGGLIQFVGDRYYEKGRADEIQRIRWAVADRERYNWKTEIQR